MLNIIKSIIFIFAIAITTCSSQGCAPVPVQQNFDPSRVTSLFCIL